MIDSCPLVPKSNTLNAGELQKMEFNNQYKPIASGLGSDRANRKEQQLRNLPVMGVGLIDKKG